MMTLREAQRRHWTLQTVNHGMSITSTSITYRWAAPDGSTTDRTYVSMKAALAALDIALATGGRA